MALLNSLLSNVTFLASVSDSVSKPKGLWEWLILDVFGSIKDFGWRIIIFVLVLKLVLLPLDFFQRYKMRKNAKITEELKPQMAKLKHQYADDPKMLSSKQMELNKKSGFSYFSSCIPMILTIVIFMTLFSSMRGISQYMVFDQYSAWYDTYSAAIVDYENLDPTENDGFVAKKQQQETEIARLEGLISDLETKQDKTDDDNLALAKHRADWQLAQVELQSIYLGAEAYAQAKVVEYNDENANSFLWIKSLWQPDVLWAKPIQSSKGSFESSVGDYAKIRKDKGNVGEDTLSDMLSKYDKVTKQLVESKDNKQNGYLVLVILSFVFSAGSQLIMQKLQKKSGQLDSGGAMGGGMMKFMMFVMPAIVAVFAIQYTAAFALYMVVNSGMGIVINVSLTLSMNLYDSRKKAAATSTVISYGRPDPNKIDKKHK